jgi:hypothetical protein
MAWPRRRLSEFENEIGGSRLNGIDTVIFGDDGADRAFQAINLLYRRMGKRLAAARRRLRMRPRQS